ncbi:MAG: IS3 family transposase [Bacteroidales bacterium]|nr:IS3 family transposase [Candidatus Latescibacterota bacterium]
MVSPSDRKTAAKALIKDWGFSENKGCALAGISRTGFRYVPVVRKDETEIRSRIKELAWIHKKYGYRMIAALLDREGKKVNHKRVHRIWKAEGLQLPRRRPKKKRHGNTVETVNKAQYRNHVWSYDFVADSTERGEKIRILVVVDEYTRECLELRVDSSITSRKVMDTLSWLFLLRGAPKHIRSDNGPEFIARSLCKWLEEQGCSTIFITPGSPWENPYVESFNSRLRAECLNRELFRNKKEAQKIVENWRREYNELRPHSSLGYKTPKEFAQECGEENISLHCPTSGRPPVSLRLGSEASEILSL